MGKNKNKNAKKKAKERELTQEELQELYSSNIIEENIADNCTESIKIFAANKNILRHTPSISDGLLPGERRLLYYMHNDLHARYDGPYNKVALIAGNVTKYHPHGEGNSYNTLVKLAQFWKNTQCAIDGHGGYGNPKKGRAAAARYIEAKLSYYSHKCFFEKFDTKALDMKPSYTGRDMEPENLNVKYPNIFFKISYGIGYGVMCSIPTYNFNEICQYIMDLADDPTLERVIYPDIPTGCEIIDDGQFEEICKTGRGKFRMRGKVIVNEDESYIRILSAPIQVDVGTIESEIKELVKANKLPGFIDFRDKGDLKEVKLDILFKHGVDLYRTLDVLYDNTKLLNSFPIILGAIDDYSLKMYNMRQMCLAWLDKRRESKKREIQKELVTKQSRKHMCQIVVRMFDGDNADTVLKIIKKSEDKIEAREKLKKKFDITTLQANAVVAIAFEIFTKSGIKKYKAEYESLCSECDELLLKLRSYKKIDALIKEELVEGMKLFGSDRHSKIVRENDFKKKIKIVDNLVVITQNKFVKKLNISCRSIGYIQQGDYPSFIKTYKSNDVILIADSTGMFSKVKIEDIQPVDISSKGVSLANYATVGGDIIDIFKMEEDKKKILDNKYMLLVTANGIIKKTKLSEYTSARNQISGIKLKDGDRLASALIINGDTDIVIYTSKGYGARINTADIKDVGRISIGVKGLTLSKDETVVGLDVIHSDSTHIFILTSKGYGKKCPLANFQTEERGSKPYKLTPLTGDEYIIVCKAANNKDIYKVYKNDGVTELPISEVPDILRNVKAKKIIPVRKGDTIVEVKKM